MPEEFIPEEGGTVEAFAQTATIRTVPPFLTIPQRTVQVDIYYVTSEQLTEIQARARESSEHLAFSTFALGLLVSLAPTLVAGDELRQRHPVWYSVFLFLGLSAILWGSSMAIQWYRKRGASADLIERVKISQK